MDRCQIGNDSNQRELGPHFATGDAHQAKRQRVSDNDEVGAVSANHLFDIFSRLGINQFGKQINTLRFVREAEKQIVQPDLPG